MAQPEFSKTGGILNQKTFEQHFRLERVLPSDDLRFFVERYWIIHWDLTGQEPIVQDTLEHPCINMVIERGNSRVYGITLGRSSQLLAGKGQVFGVKFRAGGFYPFVKFPVSELTGKSIAFCDVFGIESDALEKTLLNTDDTEAAVACMEDFLRPRLPERDENISLINEIVDCIVCDMQITRVEDVVQRLNISKRTMQRLFKRYVGVTPRWVIQRYRLHEAIERLENGQSIDLAQLAVQLGYFDQAHFIREFKKIVGKTPGEYARKALNDSDP
jgi:AraC-like DNA-binding protein